MKYIERTELLKYIQEEMRAANVNKTGSTHYSKANEDYYSGCYEEAKRIEFFIKNMLRVLELK